jgi:protein TonB
MSRPSTLCAVVLALIGIPVVITLAAQDEVSKPGPGITLPKPIHEQKPRYTAEAMREHIQGTVLVAAVVDKDGKVARVEVIKSLDKKYGLDEEAVAAARLWRFEPGQKDGKPVAVSVSIELTFTLRDKPENNAKPENK